MLTTFESLVQEGFSFLVSEHEFHLNSSSDTSVQWNREVYNVEMMYDRYRSFELGLQLYFNDGKDSFSYSFDEVLQLANMRDVSYVCQASTQERLSHGVLQISSIFRKICEKIELFNRKTFEMLAIMRNKNCDEYAKKFLLERIRIDAEKAWKEKNYIVIKALYEPFLVDLLESEIKKYEYACKFCPTKSLSIGCPEYEK